MVSTNDEMTTAEVLPDYSMVNCLSGTSISHFHRQNGHYCSIFQVIAIDECLIGIQDNLVFEIANLLLADDRINEQSIGESQGSFL